MRIYARQGGRGDSVGDPGANEGRATWTKRAAAPAAAPSRGCIYFRWGEVDGTPCELQAGGEGEEVPVAQNLQGSWRGGRGGEREKVGWRGGGATGWVRDDSPGVKGILHRELWGAGRGGELYGGELLWGWGAWQSPAPPPLSRLLGFLRLLPPSCSLTHSSCPQIQDGVQGRSQTGTKAERDAGACAKARAGAGWGGGKHLGEVRTLEEPAESRMRERAFRSQGTTACVELGGGERREGCVVRVRIVMGIVARGAN